MINKQEIIKRLDLKNYYTSELPSLKINGKDQAQALCPFHDDQKASLSINLQTGLFKCFGCDVKGSVFDFYMKRNDVDYRTAFNVLAKEAGLTTETQRRIVKNYDYTDETGNLLFQVVRYEPKDFKQRRPDGQNGWIYNLQGVRLVPYNLPETLKAEDVIIVEGEEDCDNLKALGLVATSNPMGAGKWELKDKQTGTIIKPYNEYFKGKRVVIIPDNDDPGKRHAQTIANNLKGIAESVKVVELPDLPDKGDVSDWIARGHTKEELFEIIKITPEWIPEEPKRLLDSLLKWNDILFLNIKTEYLLEKLIPKNSITLLFGRGGIGKTSLCMQIARAIAEGLPFADLQTIKLPVYYIDFENPLAVLKERVEKIGESDNLWVWHISNPTLPPRLDSKEWELYKDLPPGLLIYDTLRASHLSDEDKSKDTAIINARLKELRERGFTVFLLTHTPKGNENIYKGSTAWLDLSDHVLGLEGLKGDDAVEFDSDNIYRLGTRIKTRYEPHHIFLTFNPDLKGFEIAKDPDLEKLESIYELLKQSKEPLKQKELKEQIKKELDFSETEIRRLLKKGIGLHWETKRGDKNATLYIPLNSSLSVCQPIYTQQTNKQDSIKTENLTNKTISNTEQSIDNAEFDSLSGGIKQTNNLGDRCLDCILTPAQRMLCEVKKPCPKTRSL